MWKILLHFFTTSIIQARLWSMTVNDYKFFRRDRWGRGVGIYTKKGIEFEELFLNNSHEQVKSPWDRDWGSKGNLVISAYFSHPIKQNLLMKPSTFSYRRCCNHKCLFCLGTSITQTPAGKVAWRATGNPRGSWDAEDNFLR